MRHVSGCLCMCLCALFVPAPATATPIEHFVQLALQPGDPDTMLLSYAYGGEGLIVTHDGGASWSLICNGLIDPEEHARHGVAAVGSDGKLLLGVLDGVWEADAAGCAWSLSRDVGPRWVADLVQDPSDPDVIYAVTANGGEGQTNGVLRRQAGEGWTELGPRAELTILRMIVVSTGAGLRFVQSALRGFSTVTIDGEETQAPNYVIRVSDDGAQSWEEFPVELPAPASFFLLAVDPSDPDRILAYEDRDETSNPPQMDRLWVSLDGGQSFEPYLADGVLELAGALILPDGRVLLADRGSLRSEIKGLWSAPSLLQTPTPLQQDFALSCLTYDAANDIVYGCGLWELGTIDVASGAFSSRMRIDDVQSLAQCEGVDVAAACKYQLCQAFCGEPHFPLAPLCAIYQEPTCGPCAATPPAPLCELSLDGGAADGGSEADGGGADAAGADAGDAGSRGPVRSARPRRAGGGCRAAPIGHDARSGAWAAIALALTLTTRARRRRDARRRERPLELPF